MKALIHVQHLLGTGHAVRAAALGRALAARGHAVTLACGNRLPATLDTGGLCIVPLPAASALDATFSVLVDETGRPIDDAWRAKRAKRLRDLHLSENPDIFVTETFPLGRRQFAFELLPVLDQARSLPRPPLIACSVRDILVPKADKRKELAMAETAKAYYDLVLVHADPDFVRLEDSFAYCDRIAGLIRYTGYVHEAAGPARSIGDGGDGDGGDGGDGEVLVSAGGGAVGLALLRAALGARAFSTQAGGAVWRLLVGNSHADAAFDALRAEAGDSVIVERVRPDFQALLTRAKLSISQAGYNTALDVLAARCPAVFVPFEAESETEQALRATLLSKRGLCQVVRETELSPTRLAQAADAALAQPLPAKRDAKPIRTNGADVAAEILIQQAEGRYRS